MSEKIITPNDKGVMGETDSVSIQNAVNLAHELGAKVVIPRKNFRTGKGEWSITETILLPSDITIILDNCYIRQADGAFCNVFRNKNAGIIGKDAVDSEQKNIKIIGEGYSILDGGKTNGFLEGTNWLLDFKSEEGVKKTFGIRINCLIFMYNVRDFIVENIEVRNQRWHALYFLYCNNGRIADITVMAKNNIPNQDGINIRQGCHDIVIERVYGQSGDDLIALTTIDGMDSDYKVPDKSADIYNIVVNDTMGCSVINGAIVLRNQDDFKLYNVEIENLILSDLGDRNNIPYVALGIGQNGYFKNRETVLGNTYNVNATTVIADNTATMQVAATLLDCKYKNIRCLGNRYAILSLGTKLKNVSFDQVYIEKHNFPMPMRIAQPYPGRPIEFEIYERDGDYMDNVTITNLTNEFGGELIGLKKDNMNDITINGEKI